VCERERETRTEHRIIIEENVLYVKKEEIDVNASVCRVWAAKTRGLK